MKILPMWTRGIISIPVGLFWIYLSSFFAGLEAPLQGFGAGFLFVGLLFLILSVPTIYYDVIVLLITGKKQRQVTQALTGQREPFYRSIIFATGIFFIVIGQQLLFVVNSIDEKMTEILGRFTVDVALMICWGLTILGLSMAGGKFIIWLIKKYKRRMPATHPIRQSTPQFQPQHDPFRDIRGYDD